MGKKEPALGANEQSNAIAGRTHLVVKRTGLMSLMKSFGCLCAVSLSLGKVILQLQSVVSY